MKKYLKLTNFEFNRFSKFYGSLIAFIILMQLTSVFMVARAFMNDVRKLLYENALTEAAALEQIGPIHMAQVTQDVLFNFPIALSIGVMVLYCFFTWYREWSGKNTFIYRLLMLPTERISLFFSKLTVIYLAILGLIATQIILLGVGNWLLQSLVPSTFMLNLTVTEIVSSSPLLFIIIPTSFIDFIIYYGIGFLMLIVLFTAILMERSFRIAGIFMGILYCFFGALLLLSPLLVELVTEKDFLFTSEKFLLIFALGVLISGVSIWVSHYLLNRKVTI